VRILDARGSTSWQVKLGAIPPVACVVDARGSTSWQVKLGAIPPVACVVDDSGESETRHRPLDPEPNPLPSRCTD